MWRGSADYKYLGTYYLHYIPLINLNTLNSKLFEFL